MERNSSSNIPPVLGIGKVLSGPEERNSDPALPVGTGDCTSITSGSWCTNLYLRPGAVGVKPQSRSTIRPATEGDIQTLQSIIHTMSPFASRYARLMFRILGLGPRLVVLPSRPDRLGSSSSTRILTSKVENSARRCSRIVKEGSLRDDMQKYIVSRSLG